MSKLHIYGPTPQNTIRVRARCPADNSLQLGRLTVYYDTRRLALDCGVSVDMDYGYWTGHHGPRGGKGRWRVITRKWWESLPIKTWVRRTRPIIESYIR